MAKPTILVVDDDPAILALLKRHLTTSGHEVLEAQNGIEALRIVREQGVQLVITDWMMPEMDGLEFCQAVRTAELLQFVYIIVVTAHVDKARLVEAFDAGADDFLSKPIDRQELGARLNAGIRIIMLEGRLEQRTRSLHKINAEMASLNQKLEQMATTDELTGLMNRRQGVARLQEHWATALRYDHALSCIMLDIDHFKRFNDQHGHAAGDAVLQQTAAVLRAATRATDTVCRLGGEEFLVVCPRADADSAADYAERIRANIESNTVSIHGKTLHVTISAGVAQLGNSIAGANELLKAADDALYLAKGSGRNCVRVASNSPVST